MKTKLNILLLALVGLVGYSACAVLTNSWTFSTASEYTVSNTNKIEVAGGVARLVKEIKQYGHATDNEYTTNGAVLTDVTLGLDTSIELAKVGTNYVGSGTYMSQVFDGGLNNTWRSLAMRASNKSLGSHAIWESSPSENNIVALYHFNGSFLDEKQMASGSPTNFPFSSDAVFGSKSMNINSSTYFTTVGTNLLDGVTEFTITLWVKPTATPGYGGLMCAYDGANRVEYFVYQNQVYFNITIPGGGPVIQIVIPGTIAVGTWSAYTATYKSGDGLKLYLNGVYKIGQAATGAIKQKSAFVMGWWWQQNSYMRALFDEVVVYNRALTAAEVLDRYNRGGSLGVQVRSGSQPALTNAFVGPDGSSGTYFMDDVGQLKTIGLFDSSAQYIQWQAVLASDSVRSPYVEAVRIDGTTKSFCSDVWGDFQQGTFSGVTNVPAQLDTPGVTLAKGASGVMTNGIFTSRVFDAGSGVNWSKVFWDRGSELSASLYGLEGLWHMDGSLSDVSGKIPSHNGTINGGVGYVDFAKIGTYSCSFNGVDAYVSVATSFGSILQSVEFWMNASAATDGIMEFGSSSPWIAMSNQMVVVNGWAGTSPQIYVNSRLSRQLLPGWNHVSVVFSAPILADAVTIGRARGDYFYGLMDEMAVYSRVLTSAEIAAHYVAGRRDAAGRVQIQARAANVNPPDGPYSLTGNGSDLVPAGAFSGKQFFQYQAVLDGDGTASPFLSSVAVQYGSGQTMMDRTEDDFNAGLLDGVAVRLHGDEMALRPRFSSGPLNLDAGFSPQTLRLWHMDDDSWVLGNATVIDSSGNVQAGIPYVDAAVVDKGKVGYRCGSFSGAGYITASGGNLGTSNFTVSAWIKTTSSGRASVVTTYNSASPSNPYYALEVNGDGSLLKAGVVSFGVYDGSTMTSAIGNVGWVTDGTWHHLSGVRNGQQLHIYVDGLLMGTAQLSSGALSLGNAALTIAGYGNKNLFFTGNIDEVAVHGRALSEADIGDMAALGCQARSVGEFVGPVIDANQQIYWEKLYWGCDAPYGRAIKPGSVGDNGAIVGLWHCDSITNSAYVTDFSGNNNIGQVFGGISANAAGRFGGCLNVGAGGYVRVGDSGTMEVSAFTAEAWVKPTNVMSLVVMDKLSGGIGFRMGTDASGRPYLTVNTSSCTDVDVLRAQKWSLLSGTYDGQTARLYVNGLLKASLSVGSAVANTQPLMIASSFTGQIDEMVLYDQAVNSEVVYDHYRAGVGTLKFQVRSWGPDPQGAFTGPGGDTNAFFVDFDGSDMTAGIPLPVGQYFQYRAVVATEDVRVNPRLDSVRVDASGYPTDNPWVSPAAGYGSPFLGHLWSFSDVEIATNGTSIRYQVSGNNGTNWYAWAGGMWYDSTSQTNPAAQWTWSNPQSVINANIASFYDAFYQGTGGVFKFRAFLKSDAVQQVSLDRVDLGYSKGRLLLTSPNGAEVSNNAWVVGVPYNITWTSSGSVTATNVIIELYNGGGSTYLKPLASGVTNSGVFRTVIHSEPGADYRILIRDGSDPTIYDWSDNNFELIYNLHLSVPNGGEKWYVGETNGVSWESPLATEMALWVSNDDGVNNWVEVARAPAVVGTNGYVWAIQTHEAMLPSLTARMAVSTPDVATPYLAPFFDVSDQSFVMAGAVVTYPNATTGVKMGDTINVLWTSAAAGPNVRIELFDGSVWVNVAASVPNVDGTNSYTCVLNAPNPTEEALIRITSLSDARIVNESEAFLLADIRILSPKGGTPLSRDRWQISTTNYVTWVAGGAGNLVNVDYSTDGVTWTPIAANYVNTNSSGFAIVTNFAPQWIIQGPPSSSAVVRVSSVSRPDLKATTEYFDIAGVQVVSPNNGEYWEFTGTNVIRWLHQGAGFNIGLSITYNGGATTNDYVTLDPSLSIFSGIRTVNPGRLLRPSTLAKVRLVANDTLGYPIPMSDISDNYFIIRGLSMFLPSTNNVYTMGTTVPDGLRWYSAATEDPTADLYYSKDGSNFTSLIVGGTANIDAGSSLNSIPWVVSRSLEPSKTAKVKVIAGSYQAVSPVFTLRGIRVTRPAAGQTFDLGSSQFVYWTAAGLSDNAYMSNVVSVAGEGGPYVSGGLPGNTFVRNGALTWNISSDIDPTTNAVIKMIVTTPTNDLDIVMYSDPFTLRGAKILSPSTGTNWMIGTQRTIIFKAAGMAPGAVGDFYYSPDGVAFDMTHPVAVNVPMLSGVNSVTWDIENSSALTRQPSTNAVLMLISGTVTNLSKPFRMGGIKVTAPKGTDIWAVSDVTNTIQWVGVDTQPAFSLFYTVYDAPQHSAPIAAGVPGFAYDWAMTSNAIGSQVTITITDGITTNESERFVVVPSPSIRLISPAAGDFWKVGETNNVIRWVRGGNMSNDFTVGYSPFPFTVTNTIATGAFPSDNGIYYFTWGPIPNSLGQVRLVVKNNQNDNIADTLDDFRIAASFLIQPFIGTLHALEPKDVNWTTLGSVSGVDFYYSTDPFRGSNSWTLINTTGPFTAVEHARLSSYIWNVPNVRSSTAWLRIQDHAYSTTKFDIAKKGPYDDLGTFDILYYTVVWRVFDIATSNELDELSVSDSSGWSSSGLASPISRDYPYGFWNTVWFKQYFNDKITLNWSSKTVSTNLVYMTRTEAAPEYHVLASFVYDPAASVFKTVAWLERSSQIIPDPTECLVYIYDSDGNQVQVQSAGAPRSTGVFWADVGALLDKNRPYFAKVEIKHSGVIYTSGITFTLLTPSESAVAAVNAARDAILGSVSNVNENVIGVGLAQQAFRTDVTNRLQGLSNMTATISLDVTGINSNLLAFSSNAMAQLGGITNTIGVIGPGDTNLLDQVRLLTQDMAKRTARIMSRPGTVKSGTQVGILYRTQPLATVSLSVATSAGVTKFGPAAMTELSGGVYELSFTVSSLWGLGDFTVMCSDSSGASDRIILKVTGMELDDLAGSMTGISNQLAGVEGTLATMSVSVSNINNNVISVTNSLAGMIVTLDSISNSMGQVVGLTNLSGSISAMTSAVAQITVLTNMSGQLSFITNMVVQLGSLTNLTPQMAYLTNMAASTALQSQYLTNLLTRMSGLTNLTPQMGYLTNAVWQLQSLTNLNVQMAYLTNVIDQVTALTNMASSVSAMTGAVAQISGLTNMGDQLAYLTNAVGSLTTLTSLTNLNAQIAGLSNLTASTVAQSQYLTNLLTRMSGLTNLTPQMGYLTNAVGQLQSLTNLNAQMAYLTNVIDQVTALTNMADSVSAMTSAVAQISGLTNMGSQLAYLTNAVGSLTSLTNLSPQMAFLTNITTATAAQSQYLTNLLTRMSGLTNLTPQMGYLTNAVWQLQSLTNLNAQMAYLTNVIDKVTALTNMADSVSAMTGAVAQISGLTNMGSQLAYLTNAMWTMQSLTNLTPQVASLTNLTPQVASLTNLLTRMSGLTNLTPQVAYLTNSMSLLVGLTNMPDQLSSMTNVISQLTGLTNISDQVAQMTNSIATMAGMTNLPSQMNYLTNIVSQLTGLTNISDQVAQMTNSIATMAGMTNLPSQMNYLTNIVSQLTGLTNISDQVGQMTNSIATMAGMTNLPSQMNYLTNIVSQLTGLTNISDQVAQMTNSIGQVAGLTNLPNQMNYLTNIISQLTGLTNISEQVGQMTNSIGQIAGLTNLSGQMDYMTNAMAQLGVITGLVSQVANITNSLALMSGLTNVSDQVAYLTNLLTQMSSLTNIEAQVGAMTNSIGQIAAMTNLPSQMNYLTNVISQLTGLTNINAQVSAMTNSISQLSGLTNIPDQVGYLTNLLSQMSGLTNLEAQMSGLTNISTQIGSLTNSIGLLSGMTNLPSQMNYLTNIISQLSGMTNISDQVSQMTNSIGLLSGMTNLTGQMSYLTNAMAQLGMMTNTFGSLAGLTNVGEQVAALTNLNAQMIYLTNAVGALGSLSNGMAGVVSAIGQLSALTNMGSQVAVLTNSIGQIVALTNMTGQLTDLASGMAQLTEATTTISNTLASFGATMGSLEGVSNTLGAVTTMDASLTTVMSLSSNISAMVETTMGTASDSADTDTVFGRIASLEADVAKVGGSASAAAQRASGARSQANSAAGAAQRIKNTIATSTQMGSVMTDVGVIRKALEEALANISGISGTLSTEEMVKTVKSAQDTIRQVSESRGVVVPGGAGAKVEPGPFSDQKAVESLINQLSETKAMMQATRQLMDEAVNKPVVVDWLEGSK